MLNVRLPVKDLDEVEVAVIGFLRHVLSLGGIGKSAHHQFILVKLYVDFFVFLRANDPGAVNLGWMNNKAGQCWLPTGVIYRSACFVCSSEMLYVPK